MNHYKPKNDEGKINYPDLESQELLGKEAEDLVKAVLKRCEKRRRPGEYELTKTQMRRFYTEIKNIERLIVNVPDSQPVPNTIYSRIKLLKAKAIYSSNRKGNASLPDEFCKFLSHYIDEIGSRDPKSKFVSFCLLYEAFIGYASSYNLSGE